MKPTTVEEMRPLPTAKLPNVEDIYPLSPMQQGMLFHSLYQPASEMYFIQLGCHMEGGLEAGAFRRAWEEVIRRHTVLRTSFLWEGLKEPLQVVRRRVQLQWREEDWRHLDEAQRRRQWRELAVQDRQTPFNLDQAPLMRWTLARTGDESYYFRWSYSHLLLDGWCRQTIMREVFMFYEAYRKGFHIELEKPRPYRDYISWLQKQNEAEAGAFWRAELKGLHAPTRFGMEQERSTLDEGEPEYSKTMLQLSREATEKLEAFTRSLQLTQNALVQGAWAILLSQYSGAEDVMFGATVAGRSAQVRRIEAMVGLFINTLPVRVQLNREETVGAFLKRLQARQAEAREYEHTPLLKVQEWSEVPRGTPLFEHIVVFENFPVDAGMRDRVSSMRISEVENFDVNNFDLTLVINPGPELVFISSFSRKQFDSESIDRMLRQFATVLEKMAAPHQRVGELSLLTEKELHQVIFEWNQTSRDYRQKCVHELFEEQSARTPQAAAIEYEGQILSYEELNRRANQLAHYLQGMGVGPETMVGLCIDRTPEMVVGLLGILKAGAAYVPMDSSYPAERLAFMLGDAQIAVLLTQKHLRDGLPTAWVQVATMDDDWEEISRSPETNPEVDVSETNLAYVIYTSGSTGRPKGVAVTHGGLRNYLNWAIQEYQVKKGGCSPVHSSLSFDLTVTSLYPALLTGGCVCLFPQSGDMEQMVKLLEAREDINPVKLTPSHLRILNALLGQKMSTLKGPGAIVIGGEALSFFDLDFWRTQAVNTRFINEYGPTETVVGSVVYEVEAEEIGRADVPIGRPIANTRVYVVDGNFGPVPPGVAGELYIGGAGVARGYLNRPDLTAERFLPDPFSGQMGARLYRTGDRARWRSNATLEYLGRLDEQVKVRGYRIEPGEIEAVIRDHRAVKQVAVVVREDEPGNKQLVAYLVKEAGAVHAMDLHQFLAERLPEYMVPAAIVELQDLPLTPNGKLDRKALPAPQQPRAQTVHQAPRTAEEEILCGIFSEVLKVDHPGLDDNFFELGGHSLLATQVISQIRSTLEIELPLRVLFDAPTVAQLAEQVREARGGMHKLAPPLTAVERTGELPLSHAQQRLWFIDQLEPGTITFNRPFGLRLTGELNRGALQRSLNAMVQRHEILRTAFTMRNGRPVQEISAELQLQIEEIDLRDIAPEQREAEVSVRISEETAKPFDLSRGPLLRACLMDLAEQESVLLVTTHHIVGDMWSTGIIIREFGLLYEANVLEQVPVLPELKIQYADFAVWQRNWLQGEVLEQKIGYWRKQLENLPVLELPSDRPRPPIMDHRGANARFTFAAELVDKVRALSRREGVTLFMTMLTAFNVVLSKYSGQKDLAIGTIIANRNRKEIEGLIGFFSNSLVLRTTIAADATFRSLLASVRQIALEAYEHQDVPFEKLVEELQPVRDLSRSPFFQVMMILEHMQGEVLRMSGLSLQEYTFPTSVAQFDLTLQLTEWSGGIYGSFLYARELYEAERMERMASHFRNVLDQMLARPEAKITDVTLMNEAEERQILVDWNRTRAEHPEKSLPELYDEQAARTPAEIAVECEDQQLTYAELQQRANQLVRYLGILGLGREARVGICMERGINMLVAMLAALKAGVAYVPLGMDDAAERRAHVIHDAGLSAVLSEVAARPLLSGYGGIVVVELDRNWDEIGKQSKEKPAIPIDRQNLAYVIYTSGSTGKPKGVGVSHGALANFLLSMLNYPGIGESDKLLAVTPISFDIAGLEMYLPLIAGARVRIVPRAICTAGDSLAREVGDTTTIIQATPATWQMLLEAGWRPSRGLKILCGGEALPGSLAKNLVANGNTLWNMYGPTETTIWSLIAKLENAASPISIGKPIANTRVYVLDQEMKAVPVGVAGELYIGGTGLARGYWNRPDLTAEKFVPDPFTDAAGERLYRTGDLVRWRTAGDLEFIGRTDLQVKVRGYRIELGELEGALVRCEGVAQAVAIVREDRPGEKRLVGYVVRKTGHQALDLRHLRNDLKQWLPEYMLPSAVLEIEQLPLTPNGKVDRKALPVPGAQAHALGDLKPQSEEEEILCGIFANLLHLEHIGIEANFFELGGHSLLATQLISRIRSIFGVELPVRTLFEAPTVVEITERIRGMQNRSAGVAPPIVRVPRDGNFPLSYAQQRLWFLHQLQPESPAYNVPFALRLTGKLDRKALQSSLSAMVERHETLRTSFPAHQGKPVQKIEPQLQLRMEEIDLRGLPEEQREAEVKQVAQEQANRPFDLANGPMLRAVLLRTGEEEHALLVTVHHIISDGWSLAIIVKEFCAFYAAHVKGEQPDLAELKIQYPDFSVWQRDWLQGAVLEEQIAYWKKQLAGASRLDLPTDFPRTTATNDRVGQEIFDLGPELTRNLTRLSHREGVTQFIVLLAAYQLMLARYTGRHDILVGTDIANRNRIETEGLIGFFVNQLVLRTNLSGNITFRELLGRVRNTVLGAYEHQDVPFDKVVEALVPGRDAGSTPLFQVKLVLQNLPQEELVLPQLTVETMETYEAASKFDSLLTMAETKTGLRGWTRYNASLFTPATIRGFQHFFQMVLTLITEDEANRELPQEAFLGLLEQRVHSLTEQSADSPGLFVARRRKSRLSAQA